jgi:hypothetical protein
MSWADRHVATLLAGRTVRFRPRGHSMRGRIDDGQLVTLEPITDDPEPGQAVLCRVRSSHYVHLIKATRGAGVNKQFLIGNNRGGINGWINRSRIYGVVTHVGD